MTINVYPTPQQWNFNTEEEKKARERVQKLCSDAKESKINNQVLDFIEQLKKASKYTQKTQKKGRKECYDSAGGKSWFSGWIDVDHELTMSDELNINKYFPDTNILSKIGRCLKKVTEQSNDDIIVQVFREAIPQEGKTFSSASQIEQLIETTKFFNLSEEFFPRNIIKKFVEKDMESVATSLKKGETQKKIPFVKYFNKTASDEEKEIFSTLRNTFSTAVEKHQQAIATNTLLQKAEKISNSQFKAESALVEIPDLSGAEKTFVQQGTQFISNYIVARL